MDLKTKYLGFDLQHPLIVGASPLSLDLDKVKRLEDAGAAAVVLPSLFEEQITREELGTILDMDLHAESFAEAISYFPKPEEFRLGPENYLEQIQKVKKAVGVPVIASLNGTTPLGWLDYAKQIQQAGADALELNVYFMATDPTESGETLERRMVDLVRAVKSTVKLPIAVKLSPYFSALPHFAKSLETAGANALVLFNRFLQPDIDIENLDVAPTIELSTPDEFRLRVQWLALLYGNLKVPMAVSGGVHSSEDAIKAVMAGASAVQMVSAVYKQGPAAFSTVLSGMKQWLEAHDYDSLVQMRGSLSLQKCPNAKALERANYMRVLTGWKV
jgi:dihydroorotate dehydrogenase (fumarate)